MVSLLAWRSAGHAPRAGGYAAQSILKKLRSCPARTGLRRKSLGDGPPAKMRPTAFLNTQSREEFYAKWDRQGRLARTVTSRRSVTRLVGDCSIPNSRATWGRQSAARPHADGEVGWKRPRAVGRRRRRR